MVRENREMHGKVDQNRCILGDTSLCQKATKEHVCSNEILDCDGNLEKHEIQSIKTAFGGIITDKLLVWLPKYRSD